jgi:fibronectin-binding autotransporter adhesin
MRSGGDRANEANNDLDAFMAMKRDIRSQFLRGGRITRWKGKVASCAPYTVDLHSLSAPRLLVAAFLAMFAAAPAAGADLYWDVNGTTGIGSGGNGTWDTSTSLWNQASDGVTGPMVPWNNSGSDKAIFGGTAGTVNIGAPIIAHDIEFSVSGYTLGAIGSNTLTLADPNASITVDTGTATISAGIAGTAGLTKEGTGSLLLRGNNTFQGAVTVNAGTLDVDTNARLGNVANTVNLGAASLTASGSLAGRTVNLTGGTGTLTGAGVGDAHYTGSGAVQISAGVTMRDDTNDYTGPTALFVNGTGAFTSVRDEGQPSSLGAGSGANGTITFTAARPGADVASYVGPGDSSNRNWVITYYTGLGASSGAYLENRGTGKLTLTGNVSVQFSTIQANFSAVTSDMDVLGVISSDSPIRNIGFTGSGSARTITLGGANTFGGPALIGSVTVSAPTLASSGVASSLGAGSSVFLQNQGVLSYTGGTTTTDRAWNMDGATTLRNDGSSSLNLTGPMTFSATPTDTLTLGGSSTAVNTVSGAISGTGNLVGNSSGTWVLAGDNSAHTGTLSLQGGTLQAGSATALGTVTSVDIDGGTLDMAGHDLATPLLNGDGGTLALGSGNLSLDMATGTSSAYRGSITGSGGLTKSGGGTLTLSGANAYTGATTVNGGTLALDFSAPGAPVNNIIASTSALNMGGGTLAVTGGGTANTQTFNGLNITAGNNTISAVAGSGGSLDVNFGPVAHSGGLVNFVTPASGKLKTSTGTLGGWATVNGSDYAKVSGGNIVPFMPSDYINQDDASQWSTGQILSDAGGTANTPFFNTVGSSVQIGGLQYTAAANSAVTVANGQTLGVDGTIIVAPSVGAHDQTIMGGALTGTAGGGALGVQQNGAGTFTIASQVTNNGGTIAFTKAGTGTVALTNPSNSYTGGTIVGQGTLSVTKISAGGAPSAIGASSNDPANLVIQGSTLRYTGSGDVSDRGFTITRSGASTGSTIDVAQPTATLEFDGMVTSPDGADFTKMGPGTLVLGNDTNDYTGITTIKGGVLSVDRLADGGSPSGIGAAGSSPSNLVLDGGTLQYTGANAGSNRGFTLGSGGGGVDVSSATSTLTMSGTVAGSGALTKSGNGVLVLSGANTYTGGTVINAGVLRAGSTQAFGNGISSGPLTINGTGTLDLADFSSTLGALSGSGTINLGSSNATRLTISGGNPTFTGIIAGAGGIIRSGGGTQTISGCKNTYTGPTTISGSTVSVGCLRNGGETSDIGASPSAASNLSIGLGGQLTYTGPSVTIDRGMTLPGGWGQISVDSGTTLGFTGQVTGAGALSKLGAGVLVLSNPTGNDYSGGTNVSAGILRAGVANAFGTGSVSLSNVAGATLDLAGFNASVNGISGGGTTGGEIKLGGATLTTLGANLTFAGVISGAGSLVKTNGALGGINASQVLSGCNSSYTGSTTVRSGWLSVSCLKDGNVNSSIGASSNAASNLVIDDNGSGGIGARLIYTGAGDSTNRMFTLGAGGGALEASGTGALNFTNTAPIAMPGAANRVLTLTGTYTGNNTLAAQINNPIAGGVTSLTKTGTGTWVLSNANSTYTGVTTISGGVLAINKLADGNQPSSIGASSNAATNLVIGNGSILRYTGAGDTTNRGFSLDPGVTYIESSGTGPLTLANTGAVQLNGANQARTVALGGTNTNTNTLGGTIGDNGTGQTTLGKNGAGTWILTGNNTYTGNTVINDGTLVVGNGGTTGNAGAGNVIVFAPTSTLAINRSDTFNFNGTLSGAGALEQRGTGTAVLTAAGSSIGAARIAGGTLQVDGSLTTPTLAMSNTSALTVNGTVQNAGGTALALSGDGGNSTITVQGAGILRAQGNLGDGSDTLTVGGASGGPSFMDTGGGVLSLGAGNDNLVLQSNGNFASAVIDGGSGTDTIQVNNSTVYILRASSVQGFEALNKTLAGPLALIGNHAYSAGVTIAAGTVQVGDGSTPSSLSANVVNNGTLAFNVPGTYSFGGAISGAGGVRKIGTGVQALTGANTYTGPTNVQAGTLLVDGDQSLATGATTVSSGATLGGKGTLGGAVTIANGATLSPGDAAGTAGRLTVKGNLALGATSTLKVDFGRANEVGGTLNDLVNVGGNLTLGGTIQTNQTTGGTFGPGLYRIASYGGTLTDLGATVSPSSGMLLQKSIAGQVNLVNINGATLNFWDGDAGPQHNGQVNGGNGTWRATGDYNWTNSAGAFNAPFSNGTMAIFAGTAGTVTVDTNGNTSPVLSAGMQFANNGYVVTGDAIELQGLEAPIRVGDGTSAGAGYTATISAPLTGSAKLVKTDLGKLALSGTNTYTGGTRIDQGTLSISSDANLGDPGGALALNGGTLQTTASLGIGRTVALSGASTFLTDGGTTATLTGALSGAGALTKDGAGTLILQTNDARTGGTTIAAGTLQVGGGGAVGTLAGNVTNNGTLAFNRSDTYTYNGTIAGTGGVRQIGSGTTVLTADHSYTGGTFITSGTLQLGAGGASGMVSGNIVDNGTLAFNRADQITFNGTISGTGAVRQDGAGTTILTAANAYGGATTVNAGTLMIEGDQSLATGATSVNAGILGGTGIIGGDVAVNALATIAPGGLTVAPGTLTIKGGLNLDPNAKLAFNFGQANVVGGPYNDLIDVGGNLTLGGNLTVTQSPGGNFGPGIYRVISYGGTLTDQGLTVTSPDYTVQTSVAKQINLVNSAGVTLNYWDGDAGPKLNGQVDGGPGTWRVAVGDDTWADQTGQLNAAYTSGSFAVFAGAGDRVAVDNTGGAVQAAGMQFASTGYRIEGGDLGLVGPQAIIRVGDGTLAGAGYIATIASNLTGSSELVKEDLGTLVLSGANTYTGGTLVQRGTLSISSDANLGDPSGALTVAEGTLRTTADLSLARPVALTGAATFLTDPGTISTLSGALSGAGSLTKTGAGTLALTGDASHTGGTTIAAGTLQIGAGGTTGTLAGDVTNNGTLAFDRSDTYTYGGTVSGVGGLLQAGTGTTILTANHVYTGGTTIAAGTLQLGEGGATGMISGNVANNGTLAFHRSDDVSFAGTISGTGGVTQQGPGATTLTAANTYTGATTVNGGTLMIQGDQSLATGTTTVMAGTLGGAGTVGGDVTVSSGATLSPGAAPGTPGTFTIKGNLALNAGANLAFDFGQHDAVGGSLNDLIRVGGDVTLGGTLNVMPSAGGSFGPGLYRVISYDGNLLGGTLALGTLPAGMNLQVQTAIPHQVNLAAAATTPLTYWDGDAGPRDDGQIAGGDGTWRAASDNNWVSAAGTTNGPYTNGGFPIFAAAPGTVTVDASQGDVRASGMQFATSGYTVQGDAITLTGADATIRVGDGTADGASYIATIDAPLTGSAGLSKTDFGTLVLGGASDYTGATTVAGGTLTVNGSIANSAVTAQAGTTLAGTGTVGAATIAAGATVAPGGNAIGTLTVNGDYAQQGGATYQAQVDPASTAADRIAVSGVATLGEGAVINVTKTGNSAYVPGTRYTVLSAAGGLNGAFTLTGDTALSAFIGLAAAYDANNAYLSVQQSRALDTVAQTSNQTSTARGVDSLSVDNAVKTAMLNLPDDASARSALNQLSGEIHGSMQTASILDSHFVRDAATDRMREAFCGVGSEGDRRDVSGTEPRADTSRCGPEARRPTGWARVFGGWQHTDSNGNAGAMDDSTSGILVGVDAAVSENWRVGVMTGYSHSDIDVDSRQSSGSSDNYHLGVYGGAQWGALGLRTGATYTWQDISTSRSVNVGNFSDYPSGDYNARMAQVFGDLGYRIDAGRFSYEPFVNVAYVKLDTDSFTEDGGAAALHSPGDTTDVTFSTLGLRGSAAIELGSMQGTLRGSLGWRHAFGDDTPTSRLKFQGGQQFGVAGVPIAQDAAVIDAGLDVNLTKNAVLGVSYGGQFAGSSTAQSVQATLRVRF